jgi:hypothetical protein
MMFVAIPVGYTTTGLYVRRYGNSGIRLGITNPFFQIITSQGLSHFFSPFLFFETATEQQVYF